MFFLFPCMLFYFYKIKEYIQCKALGQIIKLDQVTTTVGSSIQIHTQRERETITNIEVLSNVSVSLPRMYRSCLKGMLSSPFRTLRSIVPCIKALFCDVLVITSAHSLNQIATNSYTQTTSYSKSCSRSQFQGREQQNLHTHKHIAHQQRLKIREFLRV